MRFAWLKDIWKTDRRIQARRELADVVAYYWDGSSSRPHELLNVSISGSYMLTDDRRYPDTILKLTLQRAPAGDAVASHRTNEGLTSIGVLARVVRSGTDGVGLQFVFPDRARVMDKSRYPECASDPVQLGRFLDRAEAEQKLALVAKPC